MKPYLKILILTGVFILLVFGISIYTIIKNEIGINSNDKIITEIEKLTKENSEDFNQLTSFLINVKTYSKDFEIDNHPKQGIKYYSYTDRKESGISFEEYKKRYYKNIPDGTSPCYVPDIEIPKSMFSSIMNKYDLRTARLKIDCAQKIVSFTFKYRHFYPTDRDIIIHYYPEGLCNVIKFTDIKDIDSKGYYWNYRIDSNWYIESKKE